MKGIRQFTYMISCTSVLLLVVACATPAPTATPVPPTAPSARPALTETPVALASTKVPQTTSKGWATLAPRPSSTAQAAGLTVEKSDSITYATVDQQPTGLYIYAPSEPGPWPVVVVVHGYLQGPAQFDNLSRAIAREGAVVYNIDANFDSPHLIGITRIACAVRFARATAPDYGGDPSRITLVGNSRGAATGAVVALAGDDFEGECVMSDGSARPDALVGYEGGYDYATSGDLDRPSVRTMSILRETDPELWEALNPYSHIGRNPNLQIRLIHGDDFDSRWYDISPEVSTEFHQALADAGYDVELTIVENASHIDLTVPDTRGFTLTVQQVMELARGSSP